MKPERERAAGAPPRGERGIALVMALMVMMAMSLLSILLMITLNVETKIAGRSARNTQALNVAEAGIGEALSRIRTGDIPNNQNPLMVAQVFLAAPGSVPIVGADTIPMATGQPAGQWMDYSTPTKGPDVLTVRYKTDPDRTLVVHYDPSLNPPIQYNSGFPIFVVTATGRKGDTKRRIETEVIQRPFKTRVESAMSVKTGIEFSGNAQVCGFNHRMDTPAYTPGPQGNGCEAWEIGNWDLPGSWSEGDIKSSGSAEQAGTPVKNNPNQVGFYAGPWEALGISQAEFYSWVGAPTAIPPMPPTGIYYIDNNTVYQDQSGAFSYSGGNGEGFLYVDGDLTINGNFTFRGLIYVEGDLHINGNAWLLGALIVKGKGIVKLANGSMIILYSRDAVAQNLAKYGGQFLTLSWRELTSR